MFPSPSSDFLSTLCSSSHSLSSPCPSSCFHFAPAFLFAIFPFYFKITLLVFLPFCFLPFLSSCFLSSPSSFLLPFPFLSSPPPPDTHSHSCLPPFFLTASYALLFTPRPTCLPQRLLPLFSPPSSLFPYPLPSHLSPLLPHLFHPLNHLPPSVPLMPFLLPLCFPSPSSSSSSYHVLLPLPYSSQCKQ